MRPDETFDLYADIPASVDTREAAAILGCGTTTVRNLIERGDIRTVRLGRLVRIPRSEIIRLLDVRGER